MHNFPLIIFICWKPLPNLGPGSLPALAQNSPTSTSWKCRRGACLGAGERFGADGFSAVVIGEVKALSHLSRCHALAFGTCIGLWCFTSHKRGCQMIHRGLSGLTCWFLKSFVALCSNSASCEAMKVLEAYKATLYLFLNEMFGFACLIYYASETNCTINKLYYKLG